MKPFARAASCCFVFLLMVGCASTEVTERQRYEGAQLARPDHIVVHDFTADPAEVPPESAFADKLAGAAPPTPEQAELARKLGDQIAQELVAELQDAGLPAVAANGAAAPQVDDLVIRGYFVSVDEGSARERVLVGFGKGAAELHTAVEGFQMTSSGLRRLGGGEVGSGGSDMPGAVLPLAVLAATANPIGLVVGGAVKLTGEATGSDTIEGAAKRTAEEIAAQIKQAAEAQGWI